MGIILFIIGLVGGAIISWFFAHKYYKKALKDSNEANTIYYFEKLLVDKEWEKITIKGKEILVRKDNNLYQIHIGKFENEFTEPWATDFHNPLASMHTVYLKIGETLIFSLPFISLDGGRISVPLPKIEIEDNETIYVWEKESLSAKVSDVIGEYHVHETLNGVAKRANIIVK